MLFFGDTASGLAGIYGKFAAQERPYYSNR